MTYWGTNTYLVGSGSVAVIDPGPDMEAHLDVILGSLGTTERITGIFVTHRHVDHTALAARLAAEASAPVYSFADPASVRTETMSLLAGAGLAGGGEGVDSDFAPDIELVDGATISIGEASLKVIHTPGHLGDHLCFAFGDVLFSGDHVMGWSTSIVSPPDGDLSQFMRSCRRLQSSSSRSFLPGHGAVLNNPRVRIQELISHRRMREMQIIEVLATGPADIPSISAKIYSELQKELLPAAERNVFAHIIDLFDRNLISADPKLGQNAVLRLKD